MLFGVHMHLSWRLVVPALRKSAKVLYFQLLTCIVIASCSLSVYAQPVPPKLEPVEHTFVIHNFRTEGGIRYPEVREDRLRTPMAVCTSTRRETTQFFCPRTTWPI